MADTGTPAVEATAAEDRAADAAEDRAADAEEEAAASEGDREAKKKKKKKKKKPGIRGTAARCVTDIYPPHSFPSRPRPALCITRHAFNHHRGNVHLQSLIAIQTPHTLQCPSFSRSERSIAVRLLSHYPTMTSAAAQSDDAGTTLSATSGTAGSTVTSALDQPAGATVDKRRFVLG